MNLADLLAQDLKTVETDELLAGVRDAEKTGNEVLGWSARLVQELRAREIPWSHLVRETGVPQTTLWRRANPEKKSP
jgi:hypothetical protein